MLTAGLHAVALARFGGFWVKHGGGGDGFAWLLMGLAAFGVAIWAVSQSGERAPAKD